MTFEQLHLAAPLLRALQEEGYTQPTPIQQKAIPVVLEGRDIIGCAQTGTGKTAAFALPILQNIAQQEAADNKRHIRVLIVTPTRELAIQIDESFAAYGRHMQLTHTVIFGGVSQHAQTKALQRGVDILTATPGRLLDLCNQGFIRLNNIEIFVLDEADRMLDMGFIHDVKKLVKLLPQKRQSLFFSATMPDSIVKLANTIVHNAKFVSVQPVSSTAEKINQSVYFVEAPEKRKLLIHLLKDASIRSALVFTRTKHGANKVTKMLNLANIKAEAIHGNKSQNARQMALKNFKAGDTRVLVATDIAARGIDIDELAYVINYEVPNIPETYVHRIGRTGRAGASGIAVSFCDREERAYLKDIQKLIRMDIPEATDNSWEHAVEVPDARVEYGKRPAAPRKDKPAENRESDAAKKPRRKKPGYRRTNG